MCETAISFSLFVFKLQFKIEQFISILRKRIIAKVKVPFENIPTITRVDLEFLY